MSAGVALTTEVKDSASRKLRELAMRVKNLEPALDEIGASNVTETQHRFEEQRAPDGSSWKGLSVATLAKRKASNPKILRQDDHLFDSITHEVDAARGVARIGTNRRYARVQQLGGNAGRGRKVSIPARPFLGISEAGRNEVLEILRDHVAGQS